MIAIKRVGYGGKVALPEQEFEIDEQEAARLEKAGAAKRVEVPKKGA